MAKKQHPRFVVRVVRPVGNWGGVGPFIVKARTADDAFRIVRGRFGGMIRDHLSREYRPLQCGYSFSFQPGRVLPSH